MRGALVCRCVWRVVVLLWLICWRVRGVRFGVCVCLVAVRVCGVCACLVGVLVACMRLSGVGVRGCLCVFVVCC